MARHTKHGHWFTWTIRVRGADRTIKWRDGELSGDEWLIEMVHHGTGDVPPSIDPIPYSMADGWRANPFIAQFILGRIGPLIAHGRINWAAAGTWEVQ